MAFTEKLKLILDVETSNAKQGFRDFGMAVREAEGGLGKLKAAGQSAMASLKANSQQLALAGGAALVGFAVKGAQAFVELAKESINLGKATGFSTEQASRWIAVADDYQISAEQLGTAVGKIDKSLDADKWAKYGVATRDAAGHTRDANGIFLDALDMLGHVSNTTERARIGAELFGRGWSNLAPIVGKTRSEYEKMLVAVSGGQVITDAEARKAEKLRLAEDSLGDAFKDLEIAIGELAANAAPALGLVSTGIGGLAKAVGILTGGDAKSMSAPVREYVEAWQSGKGEVIDAITKIANANLKADSTMGTLKSGFLDFVGELADRGTLAEDRWNHMAGALQEVGKTTQEGFSAGIDQLRLWLSLAEAGDTQAQAYNEHWGITKERVDALAGAMPGLATTTTSAADAAKQAAKDFADLTGEVDRQLSSIGDLESAQLALADQTDAYAKIAAETYLITLDSTRTDEEKAAAVRKLREAQLDLVGSIEQVAQKAAVESGAVEGTTAFYVAQKEALIKMREQYPYLVGDIDKYTAALDRIPAVKYTTVESSASTGDYTASMRAKLGEFDIPGRAAGGPAGGVTLVGERGPELVNLPGGSYVNNATDTASMLGGATHNVSLVVNVSGGSGAAIMSDPHAFGQAAVDAINTYYRSGGTRLT